MKTLFLLIMLTRNDAGNINAAFINTETQIQCAQKQEWLEGMFTSLDIPVLESHCMESTVQFTKFTHAPSSSAPRYFYYLAFKKHTVHIENVSNWQHCLNRQRKSPQETKEYCASSTQSMNNP